MNAPAHDHTDSASAAQPAWKGLLGTFGAVVLGVVLLVAAWAKLLDPESFTEQIRIEGLDFLLPAAAVALIALALEVGLGLALVMGLRRLWVLIPAALLVAFFLFLTGRTYYLAAHGLLEEANSCGCFGNLVERTPAEAFWQDLLLLVPPLLLAFLGRGRGREEGFPRVRTAVVGLATVGALIFAVQAPELPLDDLATRLRPGIDVGDLCTGADDARYCLSLIIPELLEGRHVVVIADLSSDEAMGAFGESVAEYNEYTLQGAGPTFWVIAELTPEQLTRFYWQFGPAFPVREAPDALLRPLYRRLPRSFVVEDGRIVETYAGAPPLAELSGRDSVATEIAHRSEGNDSPTNPVP